MAHLGILGFGSKPCDARESLAFGVELERGALGNVGELRTEGPSVDVEKCMSGLRGAKGIDAGGVISVFSLFKLSDGAHLPPAILIKAAN